MADAFAIYGGHTPNRLSGLMYEYCLLDDYPSYEEARSFFLDSFHTTALLKRASMMSPDNAAEFVYREYLSEKLPQTEFENLDTMVQSMIKMSLAEPTNQYEREAREILIANCDLVED